MKVSALIPTYNRAKYMRHTIESVLAQTHPVDEIVVVGDGSTHGTGEWDTLSSGCVITPAVLAMLGVSEATQQRALAARFLGMIRTMSFMAQRAAVLNLWMELLRSCRCEYVERRVVADARLAVAELYREQGKFWQSLLTAWHAVITRPMMLGRLLKLLRRWLQIRR